MSGSVRSRRERRGDSPSTARPRGPLLAWLLAAASLWAAAASATERVEPTFAERPDDQLLILELRLGRSRLHEGLVAYLDRDRLFVPLGELARALDFAIDIDPAGGTAEGYFLRQHRRFSLDLDRAEAVVEGRRLDLPRGMAERHVEDIYIDASSIARFWPLALVADLPRSRLLVEAREPLPIEERLERRRRRQRLELGRDDDLASGEAVEPLPYRLLDWPTVEHRLAFSASRGENERRSTQSNLLAAGDLLASSAELAVAQQSGEQADVRLRLGRSDHRGGLLGPLAATSFAVGDLPTPGRALVSQEDYARGVEISSFPLDRPETFDRITLRGDALPGWEAELYRNGELFAASSIVEDGRYLFTEIPLELGLNVLRVVLYGPRGQRRERVERLLIGAQSILAGETHYRVAVHQHGRRLLTPAPAAAAGEPAIGLGGVGVGVGGATIDLESRPLSPRQVDLGEARYFAELEHGFRRGLGVGARFQSLPIEGRRRSYLGLGAVVGHRALLGQVEAVAELDGGFAGRVVVEGHLDRLVVRAEHRRFDDFTSETTSEDPLRFSTRLRLERRGLTWRSGWSLGLGLDADIERRASGERRTANLRTTLRTRGLAAAHMLELIENGAGARAQSRLFASLRRGAWRVRGGLVQRWRPEAGLDALELGIQRRLPRFTGPSRLRATLRLDRDAKGDIDVGVGVGADARLGAFDVGLDLGYEQSATGESWRVGASLSYALTFDPHRRRLRIQPRSRAGASQGAAAARVFFDRDLDGRLSPGDRPLSNVEVEASGGRPALTDEHGIAWLGGLDPGRRIELGPDASTLEDPYWLPSRPTRALIPRAGRVAALDFPIVPSGEIDGTVYRPRDGGGIEPVGGVELLLVDDAGAEVARTSSAYDGFYLFTQVPPGRYRLRLDADQRRRLGLAPLPDDELRIGAEGSVLSGVDRVIRRLDTRGADGA